MYYFRLRVSNKGRRKAESVEAIARELKRRHADGRTFSRVNSCLPMNLRWSHTREVFLPAISPKTYKHCDLAHVVDPAERKHFPLEQKTWPNVEPDSTILSFDTTVQPYIKTHLVQPGTYWLQIVVAAANAEPIHRTLEITLKGDWFKEEQNMLAQGIGIRMLSRPPRVGGGASTSCPQR